MKTTALIGALLGAALLAGCASTAAAPRAATTSPRGAQAPRGSPPADPSMVSTSARRLGISEAGRPSVVVRAGDPHGTGVLVVGCIHGTECARIAIARALERARTRASGFVGGMLGTISANWSGFSGAAGFIWLVQCIGCHGESGHPHGWLATTTNGGASWSVELRHRFIADAPAWDGENGWTASNGGGASRFTATHDGGRTWTTVRVPRSPRPAFVSVADGTVWANAERCRGPYECVYPVLRGPASGSRLTPVPTTPGNRGDLNIIAVSSSSAYMFTPTGDAGARQAWDTHDGGSTWQRVAPGCPENLITVFPTVGDRHGTIWRSCAPNSNGAPDSDGHQKLGISTDGGRRWVYRSVPFSVRTLYPESAQIAWAQALSGATLRTDDRGRTWHTVWTVNKNLSLPHASFGHGPTLTARSATAATEIVPVTHTDHATHRTLTNLLVYRTTDGGTRWQRIAVALPHRT